MFNAYEDSVLSIGFQIKRDPTDASTHIIRAVYNNKSNAPLSALNMQVAVQKYMKLQMLPASSTDLAPYSQGQVT